MTSTSGAQLKISRAGASSAITTPTTTQQDEPGIITLDDGRKFEVKLMMQIGGADGKKYDVDMAKIRNEASYEYLKKLVLSHLEIYDAVAPTAGKPLSFTVHFTQHIPNESLLSSTIGNIFTRFKDDPATLIELKFKKLEYQTASGSKEVFDLEKDEFDDEKTADKVNKIVGWIAPLSSHIFSNPGPYISKPKKIKPPVQDPVTKTLNPSINDAGTIENRCASLSLAKTELAKLTSQEISDKYGLPLELTQSITDATDNDTKVKLLSNALIEKAATAIIENEAFFDPTIELQNQPCLAAIERALKEYKSAHTSYEIPATAEDKVAAYASLIRQPNFMLDLPFFLALEQPFIIIRRNNQTNLMIDVIGHHYKISDIENCDLDNVNIVYFDGKNHYKSVVLSQDDQKAAMRELIRREITSQIEAFIPRLKNNPVTKKTENIEIDDMLELFSLYPKAQEEIIERFKREYPARAVTLDNLGTIDEFHIASNLRAAIHGGPIVTFPAH